MRKGQMYGPADMRQVEGDFLIGEWVADASLPYTTVSNPRFKVMIRHMDKRYNLRSEKYYRTKIIPDIYRRVLHYVRNELADVNIKYICLCIDLWTNRYGHRAIIAFILRESQVSRKGEGHTIKKLLKIFLNLK